MGTMMSLVKFSVTSLSMNKKIQGKSSTEYYLIVIYDPLPQDIWYNYFIKSQGYNVYRNILHQGNKSSIILEANFKFSRSKRENHIKT